MNVKDYLNLDLYNLILIRYNEIWLKSTKIKMRMLKILMKNIKNLLNRKEIPFHKFQLSNDSTRLYFFFNNEDIPQACKLLNYTFGIHSFSPALRTSARIKNISERAIQIAEKIVHEGDSFALRVKRSGNHEFTSNDIAIRVGQAIVDHFKKSNIHLKVDLSNPDKKIFIEVRDQFSYLFTDIIYSEWGGLPIETHKKVTCMDVGRLSDLLAAYMLMRRGCEIHPILFDLTGSKESLKHWISNWEKAVKFIPFFSFTLIRIDFRKIIDKAIEQLKDTGFTCAICKLLRYDMLGKILSNKKDTNFDRIRAITDGLSLEKISHCPGDVELESISLNYLFTNHPIFTPLIGLESEEIINRLEKISTDFRKVEYCPYKPKNQKINTKEVYEFYSSLHIDKIITESIQHMEKIIIS